MTNPVGVFGQGAGNPAPQPQPQNAPTPAPPAGGGGQPHGGQPTPPQPAPPAPVPIQTVSAPQSRTKTGVVAIIVAFALGCTAITVASMMGVWSGDERLNDSLSVAIRRDGEVVGRLSLEWQKPLENEELDAAIEVFAERFLMKRDGEGERRVLPEFPEEPPRPTEPPRPERRRHEPIPLGPHLEEGPAGIKPIPRHGDRGEGMTPVPQRQRSNGSIDASVNDGWYGYGAQPDVEWEIEILSDVPLGPPDA